MKRIALIVFGFVLTAVIVAASPVQAAGSLFLAPNVGSYGVGSTITMRVVIGTGGQAINSAQANISYDTSLLTVTSVTRSGSIFTLWPSEPQASNGIVSFSGGLPTPGYTGSGGLLITVTFRAAATGTATVKVVSGKVLLNDGQGTNVLTGYGLATYTITNAPPTTTTTASGNVPGAPTISSASHPDQDTWYPKNTIALSWTKADGVLDFSYLYDDLPESIPDTVTDTGETSLTLTDTSDGIAYFHVRARNADGWGDTAHYRVKIDATPPEPFTIRLEGENPTGLREPYIDFLATDATSGVQKYYVVIDNGNEFEVAVGKTLNFKLPKLDFGSHRVVVQVEDAAGNAQSSTLDFGIVDRSAVTCVTNFLSNQLDRNFLIALIIILSFMLLLILFIRHQNLRMVADYRLQMIERLRRHDRKHHQQ